MDNKTKEPTGSCYPIRDEASKEVNKLLSELPAGPRTRNLSAIGALFVEVICEYEHGTADLNDMGITYRQYADVAMDLFRVLCADLKVGK